MGRALGLADRPPAGVPGAGVPPALSQEDLDHFLNAQRPRAARVASEDAALGAVP